MKNEEKENKEERGEVENEVRGDYIELYFYYHCYSCSFFYYFYI